MTLTKNSVAGGGVDSSTEIAAIQTDLGDPSARTNFTDIEDMIGIPDAANSSVDDIIRTGFDSSAITSDRDGSLMERQEDIKDDTTKIDESATSGLAGTNNSLAYRVQEIECHLHCKERWLGLAGAAEGYTPYALPVGNSAAFGAWTEILDAADTPIVAGSAYYDPHRIVIVDVPNTKELALIQFAWGAVAATAYGDGDYTEVYVFPEKPADGKSTPIQMQFPRLATDTLLWARAKQATAEAIDGTVDFFIGIHEYEG